MFKIVRFLTLLLLLLAGSLPVQRTLAQSGRLAVAYIDGDTLYSWREDKPNVVTLAKGMDDFTQVRLSPNAAQVAYQNRGALWVTQLDGAQGIQPVVTLDTLNSGKAHSRFVLDFGWLDEKTIIFNTYLINQAGPDRQGFANDLWIVDVPSGKITRWLGDGEGGAFTISPDKKQIALVRPGDYPSQKPGMISLVEVATQNHHDLFTFPFVNTAASSNFYPKPQWTSDSKRLYVTIPDPNLVYATNDLPKTGLYELIGDGKPARVGEVAADFFALPEFSPNGEFILYARRVGNAQDNQVVIYQAHRDGSQEQEIRRGKIGMLEPAHWSPGSGFTFIEGGAGQLWFGYFAGETMRFPTIRELVFDPIWADATTLVYTTSLGGEGDLRYADSVALAAPIKIVKRSTGGSFDTRRS